MASFIIENSKVVKRGRIPKGFLSSNTAYMLVYKKVTPEKRISTTKKNKQKRLDGETNIINDVIPMERTVVVKETSDSLDEEKRKCDSISVISDVSDTGKILKLDTEMKEQVETSKASPETVTMEVPVKLVSTSDEQNGKQYEFDNKENQHDAHMKKLVVKDVKLDYKRLNGAAHRAMSCGERDFYEEVNIFNFSSTSFEVIHTNVFCHFIDGI